LLNFWATLYVSVEVNRDSNTAFDVEILLQCGPCSSQLLLQKKHAQIAHRLERYVDRKQCTQHRSAHATLAVMHLYKLQPYRMFRKKTK